VISDEGSTEVQYYAEFAASHSATPEVLTINIDKTVPVITLNGPSSLTLPLGGTYVEQGAAASDNIGPVGEVQITGEVDPHVAGTYILKYNVSDQAGNAAVEAVREVIVTAPEEDDDEDEDPTGDDSGGENGEDTGSEEDEDQTGDGSG